MEEKESRIEEIIYSTVIGAAAVTTVTFAVYPEAAPSLLVDAAEYVNENIKYVIGGLATVAVSLGALLTYTLYSMGEVFEDPNLPKYLNNPSLLETSEEIELELPSANRQLLN